MIVSRPRGPGAPFGSVVPAPKGNQDTKAAILGEAMLRRSFLQLLSATPGLAFFGLSGAVATPAATAPPPPAVPNHPVSYLGAGPGDVGNMFGDLIIRRNPNAKWPGQYSNIEGLHDIVDEGDMLAHGRMYITHDQAAVAAKYGWHVSSAYGEIVVVERYPYGRP